MIQGKQAMKSTFLSKRRLALLGSVAGLSIAVLVAGPAHYQGLSLPVASASAQVLQAQQAQTAAHPAGFADLVARVKPAVISVRVKIDESAKTTGMDQKDSALPFVPGSPFDKFFREFGLPGTPNEARPHGRMITGEGSGFFISPDGYAVTNYHVVDHSSSVQVTTDEGKTFDAKVIGTDQKTDLALIKVEGKDFSYVKFADHLPRVGDWVVAVGNPFGLGGTVTAGIVSARGRDIGSGPYDDYIQIDAPINKGNSGGPAFDVDGNVIGVNTAIFSPSGGSVGIGFDIPADTVKAVVAQLKDTGHVTRGWIGVQIQPVTAGIADGLGLKNAEGALVNEPQPGSPAASAGIESGDVITALDGAAIKDSRDLARRVGTMAPGTSVKLDILRKGEQKTVTLTLGKLPDERQAKAEPAQNESPDRGVPQLGLMLAAASDAAGAGRAGVTVAAVDPNGTAAEHGFQAGDVILEVAGKAVSKPADVKQDLADLRKDGKRTVLMRVKSGDATRFVALPLA